MAQVPPDDLIAVGEGQQNGHQVLPVPLQSLPLRARAKGQLVHGQLPSLRHLFQQRWVCPGVVQHPAAGGQRPVLAGAVVRHVGEGEPEPCQLGAELLDLLLAGRAQLICPDLIPGVRQRIHQRAVLLSPARGMEGEHIPVPPFRPVVVDEPVPDGPGRKGEKGPPAFLVPQNGLIKGQHGDAQLVLVAVLRGRVDKLHRLTANKSHVLPDQGVRRLRVRLRRIYLAHDAVLCPHHVDPSAPSSRRIRSRRWIFGVTP